MPCPLRRAVFLRASAELQNQECLGCGGQFLGDSSSSLARRLELSFVFLLKPQRWKWVKWGSASCLQHVYKTGFSYSVYKCCVFLHQDTMRSSILTGMPQLSLEQTTNALASTSKATAFTCVFFCMFLVSSERNQPNFTGLPMNCRDDIAMCIKSSTFLIFASQMFPQKRAAEFVSSGNLKID